MARPKNVIGAFNFSSEIGCTAPSDTNSIISSMTTKSLVLSGALAASIFLDLLFVWIAIQRADVTPYVADGGIFGCEVKSEANR